SRTSTWPRANFGRSSRIAMTRDGSRTRVCRLRSKTRRTEFDVLNEGGIFPAVVTTLTEARNRISEAQHSNDVAQRRALIQQAITKLGEARAIVATTS